MFSVKISFFCLMRTIIIVIIIIEISQKIRRLLLSSNIGSQNMFKYMFFFFLYYCTHLIRNYLDHSKGYGIGVGVGGRGPEKRVTLKYDRSMEADKVGQKCIDFLCV